MLLIVTKPPKSTLNQSVPSWLRPLVQRLVSYLSVALRAGSPVDEFDADTVQRFWSQKLLEAPMISIQSRSGAAWMPSPRNSTVLVLPALKPESVTLAWPILLQLPPSTTLKPFC